MKRTLSLFIAAVITLLSVAGCTSGSNSEVSPDTAATPTPDGDSAQYPFHYSVTVIIDEKESGRTDAFVMEDFPGIGCIEVKDLTVVGETNKRLRLELEDPSEKSASEAVSKLNGMDHVVSAEPYIEPYSVIIGNCRVWLEESILPVESKLTVADRVFLYPNSFNIFVENEADGTACGISEAYEKGILTYDDISELYRIHKEFVIHKFEFGEEFYKAEGYVHYGYFSNCEIGFVPSEDGDVEMKEIAGYRFVFAHPFSIIVLPIASEETIDISGAFEQGLITEDDLDEICRIHREFVVKTYDFGEKLYKNHS